MDHLKTSQERRDRWYSKQAPQYTPVLKPQSPGEILSDNQNVWGIPFSWLKEDRSLLSTVLELHGFAIVTGVLSKSDCVDSLEKAWDYIEAASFAEQQIQATEENEKDTPLIRRLEPTTHASKYFPHSLEGGILPFYGSGHSTFAWSIRSHPHVQNVFELLYGTSDLISSLDGIVLWHQKQPLTDTGWFHLDQNPIAKPDRECIQGLVNLLPVSSETGGNVVVAGSHRLFPHHYTTSLHSCSEFYKDRLKELGTEDWMEVDPHDLEILKPHSIITCLLESGDMILWDSRTIHCSCPRKNQEKATVSKNQDDCNKSLNISPIVEESAHGLLRAAGLVCMMPASCVVNSSGIRQHRQLAVTEKRTLTHWVNKVAPLGEENSEQVVKETSRVEYMLEYEGATNTKVLLNYRDLSLQQKYLVVGKDALSKTTA